MKSLRGIDFLTVNIYWFSLSYFLNSLGRFIMPVLVAALVAPEVKNSALGILTAAGLVVATVIQPLMGAFSDRQYFRWGRRRPFILIGSILDFVFLVAVALSGSYVFLFIAILLLQVSTNTAHGAVQGLIPDLVPLEQRGKAGGVKSFLEFLGLILASVVTAQFLEAALKSFERGDFASGQVATLTATWIIIAVLAGGLLLTLFLVREGRLERGVAIERTGIGDIFKVDVRGNAEYFWLLGGRLFTFVGVSMVTNYAIYYLQDVVRVPDPVTVAGNIIIVAGILTLIVTFPAGYLADRVGRKPLNLLAGPLAAIVSLGFLTVTNRALFQIGPVVVTDILAVATFLGLAMGIFLSANWTWATDLVPAAEAGKYLGLSNLAGAGSGVVSGLLGGPIIDLFNRQAAGMGYNVAFILGAACFLAGTLFMLRVRETKKKLVLPTERLN